MIISSFILSVISNISNTTKKMIHFYNICIYFNFHNVTYDLNGLDKMFLKRRLILCWTWTFRIGSGAVTGTIKYSFVVMETTMVCW